MRILKRISKVEMVVVTLCGLFVLICMGAAGRAGRMRAKDAMCRAKLGQWGKIIYMYESDNDWILPRAIGGSQNWLGVTEPYIKNKNIWLCPMATKTEAEGAEQPFAANDSQRQGYKGSYGFSDWASSALPDDPKFWLTSLVSQAEKVPVLADAQRLYLITPLYTDEPPAYESDVIFGGGIAAGEMKNYSVNRHNGSVNGVFLDFSVRRIGLKELWELDWHRDWNADNDPLPEWPDWMSDFKDF